MVVADDTASVSSDGECDGDENGTAGSSSDAASVEPVAPVDLKSHADDIRAIFDGSTVFTQIWYLGKRTVRAHNNEAEIVSIMRELMNDVDDQLVADSTESSSAAATDVVLSMPNAISGQVRICDSDSSRKTLFSYEVITIKFCMRGPSGSDLENCVGFVVPGTDGFLCQVIRCQDSDVCGQIVRCFRRLFKELASSVTAVKKDGTPPSSCIVALPCFTWLGDSGLIEIQFDVFLELKEEDGKGGYSLAPLEKDCFKLRRKREKKVVVSLQQMSGPKVMSVTKCFGLLLAPGRNVRDCDMHLLDMQSVGRGNDDRTYSIEGTWDPNLSQFHVLNTESPKDTRVFMTVAADIVLVGIHEPVRVCAECKIRIYHEHERFWYTTRKPLVQRYYLGIKKIDAGGTTGGKDLEFEVLKKESSSERQARLASTRTKSPSKLPTNLISTAPEDESDSDEPPLSGSGDTNITCSEDRMKAWADCVAVWRSEADLERPKNLLQMIREGVPDSMRGEVWPLLSGCSADEEMLNAYRLLLSKECPSEQVILRDIHRTFPAHAYFKDAGGVGQESLYSLSKAYSLYDEEVGYCQGLSFIAAALLLHMPDEQAFCVLVKMMFDYELRELFKQGFEALQLRFYQLERLLQDFIPDLKQHFSVNNVEAHMYASQWFLTLFTAKFPLSMVFHILDLFLYDGVNTVFNVAVALLKDSKKDLLQLDFEGSLKYFRVVLPRKYRNEVAARELILQATRSKVSSKRLVRYEKEYIAWKQQEAESQDPLERAQREVLRLKDNVLRLERENDDLAHELVTSKIQLRQNLDAAEDNIEALQKQCERYTSQNKELQEQNQQFAQQDEQIKEMCRRELVKHEEENGKLVEIISNYKQITNDLSNRLERQSSSSLAEQKRVFDVIRTCETCRHLALSPDGVGDSTDSAAASSNNTLTSTSSEQEQQVRGLELELASTKLALVETQCRAQELLHELHSTQSELHEKKSTWLNKTITSLKDKRQRSNDSIAPHANNNGS